MTPIDQNLTYTLNKMTTRQFVFSNIVYIILTILYAAWLMFLATGTMIFQKKLITLTGGILIIGIATTVIFLLSWYQWRKDFRFTRSYTFTPDGIKIEYTESGKTKSIQYADIGEYAPWKKLSWQRYVSNRMQNPNDVSIDMYPAKRGFIITNPILSISVPEKYFVQVNKTFRSHALKQRRFVVLGP